VGGVNSRTMRLEIGTGKLWLNEAGLQRELLPSSAQKGGNTWPIVS